MNITHRGFSEYLSKLSANEAHRKVDALGIVDTRLTSDRMLRFISVPILHISKQLRLFEAEIAGSIFCQSFIQRPIETGVFA